MLEHEGDEILASFQGLVFRIHGTEFRQLLEHIGYEPLKSSGFTVQGSWYGFQDLGFVGTHGVWTSYVGSGFGVWTSSVKPSGGMGRAKGGTLISGVGFRIWDLRFGVKGLVCRVQGLGFGV